MRQPAFLGIGVQKGGTTTLHNWLSHHPDVFLPAQKEVHYYSLEFERGSEWYSKKFDGAAEEQVCGEITPYYVFHPYALSRSEADNPCRKLILLLRDPVERCLSQYFHSRRLGLESLELEAALAAEPSRLRDAEIALATPGNRHISHQEHSYLSRSRYEHQLERLDKQLEEDRLLVLRSEDLFEQPQKCWEKILHFLEIDPSIRLQYPHQAANKGEGEALEVGEDVREQLREELKSTYQILASRYSISWPNGSSHTGT